MGDSENVTNGLFFGTLSYTSIIIVISLIITRSWLFIVFFCLNLVVFAYLLLSYVKQFVYMKYLGQSIGPLLQDFKDGIVDIMCTYRNRVR